MSGKGPRDISAAQILLLVTLGLLFLGLIMVFSASSVKAYDETADSLYFFKRQLLWAVAGLVCMGILAMINYRRFASWPFLDKVTGGYVKSPAHLILLVVLALMVAVLIPGIGMKIGGARRWLGSGAVSFMPSEFLKLALLIYGSAVLSRTTGRSFKENIVPFGGFALLSLALVMLQPDMGTAIVLAVASFVMLFMSGAKLIHLIPIGTIAVALGYIMIMTEDYRRRRFLAFLDPWADPRGDGYQTIQSLVALGTGGLTGTGLGKGLQKFFFLPQAQSDFVFAILGEEFGLTGSLGVIFLYGFFAYSGIRIALHSSDRFGKILASSITGTFLFQATVNIGAVTGVLPVTGIPLPLISQGGTALFVNLCMAGILISIGRSSRLEVINADSHRGGGNRRPRLPGNRPGRVASTRTSSL